jgi:hypothetical protein
MWRCDVITRRLFVVVVLASLATTAPLFAHHSWPVNTSKLVTVAGTVTSYDWANPHVMIGLDVKTDAGTIEKWTVGGPSVTRMANNGWKPNTLKPGDVITAIGYRFTDGQPILRLEKIVMTDGTEMFLYGRRR